MGSNQSVAYCWQRKCGHVRNTKNFLCDNLELKSPSIHGPSPRNLNYIEDRKIVLFLSQRLDGTGILILLVLTPDPDQVLLPRMASHSVGIARPSIATDSPLCSSLPRIILKCSFLGNRDILHAHDSCFIAKKKKGTSTSTSKSKNKKTEGFSFASISAIGGLFGGLFKSADDNGEATRQLFESTVYSVNAFESTVMSLSDEELRSKTDEFKERVAKGDSLDSILPVSLNMFPPRI